MVRGAPAVRGAGGGDPGFGAVASLDADRVLSALLAERGAHVIEAATIRIEEPASYGALDAAIANLDHYDWVVFTSTNAAGAFFERLEAAGKDARALSGIRVATVGSTTESSVRRFGIRPELVPPSFTGEDLAAALGSGAGRVLLPRAEGAPRALVDALEEAGWKVDEVTAYRNVPAAATSPGIAEVLAGSFDVMTVTSGSTVRNLAALASADDLGLGPDGERRVACIGPTTADAARALGFRVDVVAEPHTIEGLVAAVESLRPNFSPK